MKHFLGIGEFKTSRDGEIYTMLGSCLSVVLYHPQTKYSSMSHFQLPYETRSRPNLKDFDYVDKGLEKQLDDFLENTNSPNFLSNSYTCELYGACCSENLKDLSVNKKNIDEARNILKKRKVRYHEIEVLKNYSIDILLDCETGNVKIRKL